MRGFLKSKSVDTAVTEFNNKVILALDNERYVLVINMTKGFDSINYTLFLNKLEK